MIIIITMIITPITNHRFNGQTELVGIELRFKKICFVNMLLIILKIIIEEAATIDPIETIFVGKYDAKKAIIPIMQITGEYPSATPAPVATAFPPLNFRKIGNFKPKIKVTKRTNIDNIVKTNILGGFQLK